MPLTKFERLLTEAIGAEKRGETPFSYWRDFFERLRAAAQDEPVRDDEIASHLRAAFDRELRGVRKYHPGIPAYTVERLSPVLRKKLDERILQAADLIRLRRKESIENTLARFTGWSSSLPEMRKRIDTREVREHIYKPIAQIKYERRRVAIDQTHKLAASIHEVIAEGGGAIAMIWRSNWRQVNYDYRQDHKERDGKIWVLPGTWATKAGLISAKAPRYDEITHVAEEPYCRCYATWIYSPDELPASMLTAKGAAYARNQQAA